MTVLHFRLFQGKSDLAIWGGGVYHTDDLRVNHTDDLRVNHTDDLRVKHTDDLRVNHCKYTPTQIDKSVYPQIACMIYPCTIYLPHQIVVFEQNFTSCFASQRFFCERPTSNRAVYTHIFLSHSVH